MYKVNLANVLYTGRAFAISDLHLDSLVLTNPCADVGGGCAVQLPALYCGFVLHSVEGGQCQGYSQGPRGDVQGGRPLSAFSHLPSPPMQVFGQNMWEPGLEVCEQIL